MLRQNVIKHRTEAAFFPSREMGSRLERKSGFVLDVEEATGKPRLVAGQHITTETPIGLFASGNPINLMDPFGLGAVDSLGSRIIEGIGSILSSFNEQDYKTEQYWKKVATLPASQQREANFSGWPGGGVVLAAYSFSEGDTFQGFQYLKQTAVDAIPLVVGMGVMRFSSGVTTDSQYFISSGVRRSLSSLKNGLNEIPAIIVQEGQADIPTTLNLNQLYSPKFEVPANSRLLNIQPPIQVPIEVQPLGIPNQPPSIPLNQVEIVPPEE